LIDSKQTPKPRIKREMDPLDRMVGYHIRRMSVIAMTDLAEALAPLGLRPASASALFLIGTRPGITQSELGKVLGILRANMTPVTSSLIAQGLIERRPLDGRSQTLRLSAKGRETRRRALKATLMHEERLFGTLSGADRMRLIAQLRDLWQAREPAREGAAA